jgi:hypothetical protein
MDPTQDDSPQASLSEELRAMKVEPLLPVEKRLIVISLALGVLLLGILWWVSATFFSAPCRQPGATPFTCRPPPTPRWL